MGSGLSMEENTHIPSWLHFLRCLYPPIGTILVGAGSGNGDWVTLLSSWETSNVLLVEADEKKFQHLSAVVQTKDGWKARQQLIAENDAEVIFYLANNSLENGLLDPQTLRNIWPNIETRHEITLPATTLASLQNECAQYANWLIVDCLPGIPIIVGAGDTLHQFDVVVLRMLLSHDLLLESLSQLDAVDEFMSEQGFRCIAVEPERHPALGHGLYVRDFPQIIQQQLEQNNQLKNNLIVSEKRVSERDQQLANVDKAKDEQALLITDLTNQMAELVQSEQKQVPLTDNLQVQIKQLLDEKNVIEEHASETAQHLEVIRKGKDQQAKLAEEREKKLLEQIAEKEHRQSQIEEHLLNAEGQIALITNLLLREQER